MLCKTAESLYGNKIHYLSNKRNCNGWNVYLRFYITVKI